MNSLFCFVFFLVWVNVNGRRRFLPIVPNARNVVVGDQSVFGLGHLSFTARTARRSTANQFGLDVEDAANEGGSPDAIWEAICNLDSDGDGILNKDELCDPDCVNAGRNPACTGNLTLRHPGNFDVIIDEDNDDGGNDDNGDNGGAGVGNRAAEIDDMYLTAHAWLMILAWVVFAPIGIALPLIFKKGDLSFWFFWHKIFLAISLLFTLIGFFLLIGRFGDEPIKNAFEEPDLDFSKHVIIGLSVISLVIIQPISGMVRPHLPKEGEDKSLVRTFWEFQHRWTGRLCLVLAIVAIDYGILIFYPDADIAGNLVVGGLVVVGAAAIAYVVFFRDHVSETYFSRSEVEDDNKNMDEGKEDVAPAEETVKSTL